MGTPPSPLQSPVGFPAQARWHPWHPPHGHPSTPPTKIPPSPLGVSHQPLHLPTDLLPAATTTLLFPAALRSPASVSSCPGVPVPVTPSGSSDLSGLKGFFQPPSPCPGLRGVPLGLPRLRWPCPARHAGDTNDTRPGTSRGGLHQEGDPGLGVNGVCREQHGVRFSFLGTFWRGSAV